MTRALVLLLLLAGCGEDGTRVLAALGLPDAQGQLIQGCCECLADSAPPDGAPLCDSGDRCLCDDDAFQCTNKLGAESAPIALVGACTNAGGACEEACRDVLSFEPE